MDNRTVEVPTDPLVPCTPASLGFPSQGTPSIPLGSKHSTSAATDRFWNSCVVSPVHTSPFPMGPDQASTSTPRLPFDPQLQNSVNSAEELLIVEGRLGTQAVQVLIDSGANGNFVNEDTIRKSGLGTPSTASRPLTIADGSTISCFLTPNVPLSVNGFSMTLDLLSTPLAYDVILGKPWLAEHNPLIDWRNNTISFISSTGQAITWNALGTPSLDEPPMSAGRLKRLLRDKETKSYLLFIKDLEEFHQALDDTTKGQPDYLRQTLLDYEEVFSGVQGLPPSRPQDHGIDLIPDAKPPFRSIYHMSPQELEFLRNELKRLLDLGHLRPSTSSFGAPVFLIKEKTNKIRMVTDYRALNKITIKNNAALPNIRELLDRLRDATIFTKIDLQSGFHLIRVKEEDVHKTAINTKYGHFEFVVMPFGLCNAPATFQSTMNDIFRDLLDVCVVVYIDDLLIFSKNHEDHQRHLQLVLQRMKEHGLRARVHKCRFLQPTVDYLGFIVGNGTIKADPKRLEAIASWPVPRDVHELRSFLGLTNTLLRFTPMYAQHAATLTDLLKGSPGKKDVLDWQSRHQTAFEQLKSVLTSPQVLHIPDENLPIILHTDWSTQAIGGWISQEIQGKELPIAYESRKLRQAERHYSPYDGELLALIHCLRIFRPYLVGRKVLVRNDQKALKWLLDQRKLSPRQERWLDILLEFRLELDWIPGSRNTVADALSRRRHDKSIGIQVYALAIDHPPEDFIAKIRRELPLDPSLQEILRLLQPGTVIPPSKQTMIRRYSLREGLLWYENTRLVVPKSLRLLILKEHHDTPVAGHPSWNVMYASLAHYYFWQNMSKDVRKYVQSCDACQRLKDGHHPPYGLLQPLQIPERPWESISMDFISQLPKTPRGSDSITVFVDRLTKMVHLVAGKTTDDASTVARQFLNSVFRQHGLPSEIISDRGSVFTSRFWKSFMGLLDTRVATSTAFHPQTDGQTERANRTVEQMLRFLVDYRQTNWDTLLPIVEFAINNNKSASTNHTPFFLNSGQHPRTPSNADLKTLVPAAQHSFDEMRSTLTLVRDLLRSAQDRMASLANEHRTELTFSPGDQVLLSTLHITVDNQANRPSQKLAPRFTGPYKVLERIGQVSYKLDIPSNLPIHPVFHISRLRPYTDPLTFDSSRDVPSRPPPELIGDVPEYEAERVLDKRTRRRRVEYLIKWVGYPETEATWEPLSHLEHAMDVVRDYDSSLSSPDAVRS